MIKQHGCGHEPGRGVGGEAAFAESSVGANFVTMETGSQQTNVFMSCFLKDATIPGASVFKNARAAEVERARRALSVIEGGFTEANATRRNRKAIGQRVSMTPRTGALSGFDSSELHAAELFRMWKGLGGVSDVSRRTCIGDTEKYQVPFKAYVINALQSGNMRTLA